LLGFDGGFRFQSQIRMAFNGFYAGSVAEGFCDHNHSDPKQEWGNFWGHYLATELVNGRLIK